MKGAVFASFGLLLRLCVCEYITINRKLPKANPCENARHTTLVENFFNIIFTEFQNTPPACVCIQMCPEQSTYCYPNGCLKRPKKREDEAVYVANQVNKVQYEGTTKSVMFLVDNNKDAVDDLLDRPDLNSYSEKTERPVSNMLIFRPNPFKEMGLIYKKRPKLEMRYNLREQVKNTKSEKLNKDKIDISKTRWPLNKYLLHGKQAFNRIRQYKNNDDTHQTKFFVSMFPEYGIANYTPVLYKKYLTKRENNDGINVEALYLYQTDVGNFSVETLIDNLIENSLDKSKKDTKIYLNTEANDTVHQELTTETNINYTEINVLQNNEDFTTTSKINATVSIISMNSTNENTDVNKYFHDLNKTNPSNMFLEMIANMSKEIDKQNTASLEFMGRVTGKRINIIENNLLFTTKDDTLQDTITTSNVTVTENVHTIANLSHNSPPSNFTVNFITTCKPILRTRPIISYKKNKQRIVRKLKHKKLN